MSPLNTAAAAMAALWSVAATPAAPPTPANYDVVVSYRIVAFRNQRVAQFDAMLKDLAARGFRREAPTDEPTDEAVDPNATRLRGTVSAANVEALLHERHVRALLIVPAGEKLPDDANQPVRVVIQLTGGLPPERQRLLHAQTAQALSALKFNEAVGYDTRGYRRLVGSMPAGQVNALLNDLHQLPGARGIPAPFATLSAVRIVEARPDLPPVAARPAAPPVPAGQEKLSSDLREVVADAARTGTPMRVEILLANEPEIREHGWARTLRSFAPGIAVEGQFGTVVTAAVRPDQLGSLAALPEVAAVRLPRGARAPRTRDEAEAMTSQVSEGLERLHAKGYRGKGARIAIVAPDFRGWHELVGRGLPKSTTLIDLTRERNENLEPDPIPAEGGPAMGTLVARAAAAALPEADLVLIRVDPSAPYMLQTLARAIAGESTETPALKERERQLDDEKNRLDIRRAELLEERRKVFEDLREEGEPLKRRETYQRDQAALDQQAREYEARIRRYIALEKGLLQLKGVRAVLSTLRWDTGHASDGPSLSSRIPESRSCLWIEPPGASRATWQGLFRDADANGALEFAAPELPLPSRSWSNELNFLAWQNPDGKESADLPAGSRIRVTLRWREPHDRNLAKTGQDYFRQPIADVRLLILRQLDPAGSKRPGDDFEIVAQSTGLAHRLEVAPHYATYEVSVDLRVPANGRYALRVEGKPPEGDRPASLPTLPALRRTPEIRPRIVVEALEGAGHPVWSDYYGDDENVGTRADRH